MLIGEPKIFVSLAEPGKVEISVNCVSCAAPNSFFTTFENFERFQIGRGLIQDLLPDVKAGHRELLVTGICEKCLTSLDD